MEGANKVTSAVDTDHIIQLSKDIQPKELAKTKAGV